MRTLATAVLATLFCAAAPADEPQSPATETRAAAEAAQTPPTKTAAQAEADAQAALDKAAKQLRQRGYSPKTGKDGRTLWCRSETPLGSRFQEQKCSTLEAVLESERNGKDYAEGVSRSSLQDRAQ
jgi:pyruvate/2-oxoglutarate dehydrogenase complex dihydrolipoamide acyltransferase (E2) component